MSTEGHVLFLQKWREYLTSWRFLLKRRVNVLCLFFRSHLHAYSSLEFVKNSCLHAYMHTERVCQRSCLLHMPALLAPCEATEVSSTAAWRTRPLGHWDVLIRIREKGQAINPLLQLPWFRTTCVRPDWLHCADLGVAADMAGNAFWIFQSLLPGRSQAARVQVLNDRLQSWYDAEKTEERIDRLLPTHFIQQDKGFKLRASAARIRAIVPFVHTMAESLLAAADPVQAALKSAAFSLHQVYSSLSDESILHNDIAREHSTRFACQWVALHKHCNPLDGRQFRMKPKLHLWLHLCSDGSRPSRFWVYRDEEFGGSVARRAHRRGGILSVQVVSRNVLQRFWMQCPAFRLA